MTGRRRRSRLVLAASLVAAAGWPVSVAAQDSGSGPAATPPPAPASPGGAPPAGPKAEPPAPAAGGAGQEAKPAPAAEPPAPQAEVPAPAEEVRIRFNFKDAPFDQVLDFFSRECGLPIINETAAPKGTVTFISGDSYTFDEALEILNQILLMHRV